MTAPDLWIVADSDRDTDDHTGRAPGRVRPGGFSGKPLEDDDPARLLPLTLAGSGDNDWASRAVCATQDPDVLFVTGAAQREAARLCQGCPVKLECLADALDNRVEFGVWGGLTERQRRALLKRCPDVTSWRSVLEDARAEATRQVAG